jgi:hypothetical protein
MALDITPLESRLSYLAALDPWRKSSYVEVERLLKLAALTARQVVISDNQALNNSGLQRLLGRPDVVEFFSTPDGTGALPVAIALRQGTINFEEVAQRLVVNRERPAIFPWMSRTQQARLDAAYKERSYTVGPLFDIGGSSFRRHVERLNAILESGTGVHTAWSGLEEGYVSAATTALSRFRDALAVSDSGQHLNAINVCGRLLREIELGSEINRSNLYRIIEQARLEKRSSLSIRLKGLDEPYHGNFARKGGYHSVTGDEYKEADVTTLMNSISERLRGLRPVDVFEINEFPVFLNQVPFDRISRLRMSPSFHGLLDDVYFAQDGEKRFKAIFDLLNLISGELSKEPKALRKLSRLRLHVFQTPREFNDELARAGVTLSDIVAAASKGTGFLIGETIGALIGIFAVGGLLGAGAAVIVEQISERAQQEHRQKEFQQVLQFLTINSQRDPPSNL